MVHKVRIQLGSFGPKPDALPTKSPRFGVHNSDVYDSNILQQESPVFPGLYTAIC